MKLLTYNIHKGLSWNGKRFVLKQLQQSLSMVDPDIMFLQEVVGHHSKLAHKYSDWIHDQTEFLALDNWSYSYSAHAQYEGRHHGNSILSRFELNERHTHDLTLHNLEKRGLLFSSVQIENTQVHLYCTHLNLFQHHRQKQLEIICDFIFKNTPIETPVILAGDFNDWSKKATQILDQKLAMKEAHYRVHHKYAKTFPAKLPVTSLDRVYTRGLKIIKAEVLSGTPWNKLSDHLPLVIECEL